MASAARQQRWVARPRLLARPRLSELLLVLLLLLVRRSGPDFSLTSLLQDSVLLSSAGRK
jgi:hypothetical protein